MSRFSEIVKRVRGDGVARALAKRQMEQLKRIDARLTRIEQLLEQSAGVDYRATIDRGSWQGAAQEGELAFHKTNAGFRGSEGVWQAAVDRDWRVAGFTPDAWRGKTVLDVGAGSRLRSLWFEDVELLVLEPLADRFRKEVEWCDLDRAQEIYSLPGEEFVPQLEKRCDLVVSINALDHGFDIAQSFRNIRRYLKDDGEAFLSFDMHTKPDHMHPLVLNNEMVLEMYAEAGFQVVKCEPARRYHGAVGPSAYHYWLKPLPVEEVAVPRSRSAQEVTEPA
ncbi:MAG: class I SAM-dependent methyltransferase [Hamadaea sp.]|nr:class I SAM-dependent methyltransferase [Hamadaea sp.]